MGLVEQMDLEFRKKWKYSKRKIIFSKVKIIFSLCIYEAFMSWIKHSKYIEENLGKDIPELIRLSWKF